METIRAIVTRILKEDTETGRVFATAQYETPEGLATAKVSGFARGMRPGDCFAADGAWESKQFRGHPDLVFRARQLRADLPRTTWGAERFLSAILDDASHGVPSGAARTLVAASGAGVLWKAVADPEILVGLSRDPARFRDAILAEWASRTQGGQAVSVMEASGIGSRVIDRIIAGLPPERPFERLKSNPWQVARIRDVGFDNADRIGLHMGFTRDDRRRLTEAVAAVLQEREIQGSTAASLETVMAGLSEKSRIGQDLLISFLHDAARRTDHDLAIYDTPAGPVTALLRLYVAEIDVQNRVMAMLAEGRRNPREQVRTAAAALFARPAFARFDAVQRTAVEMAVTEPLSLLTGGPGTGKSTVMDAVACLSEVVDRGLLFLAAPTGKAAKRLEETTGKKAQTVYRLLKARMAGGGAGTEFGHTRQNPLPGRCVVIIDEISMLDSESAAALMNAMPADGRLLLVGDRNQLPSVGAGSVLADLLDAQAGGRPAVPSVQLVNVYRTSADSGIATGAALVREGKLPELFPEDRGGVSFIPMRGAALADGIERLVCHELPRQGWDPVRDVAVLCPMAPGPGGTWEINARLSARLNPSGEMLPGVVRGPGDDPGTPLIRAGDRVMLTENDAENDVMNGDLGTVAGSGQRGGRPTVRIAFDCGREVEYPASRWRSLILAYAMTVHKSQGSQYPVVVMAFAPAHERMLERKLVYTGWTRAQKRLILVGDHGALERGVRNPGEPRFTLLQHFLGGIRPGALRCHDSTDWAAAADRARMTMSGKGRQPSAPPRGGLFGPRPKEAPVASVASVQVPAGGIPVRQPSAPPRGGLFGPRLQPSASATAASRSPTPSRPALPPPPPGGLFGPRSRVREAPRASAGASAITATAHPGDGLSGQGQQVAPVSGGGNRVADKAGRGPPRSALFAAPGKPAPALRRSPPVQGGGPAASGPQAMGQAAAPPAAAIMAAQTGVRPSLGRLFGAKTVQRPRTGPGAASGTGASGTPGSKGCAQQAGTGGTAAPDADGPVTCAPARR